MTNRKRFLGILLGILVMVFGVLSVDAETVSVSSSGIPSGYGCLGVNKYSCPGNTSTTCNGYSSVPTLSGSFYCLECDKNFPGIDDNGIASAVSFTSTGYCYVVCDNPISGTVGPTQHNIWDIMEGGNYIGKYACTNSDSNNISSSNLLEISNSCGSTAYSLEEFSYSSSAQKIARVKELTITTTGRIIIRKRCATGVSGNFNFTVKDSNNATVDTASISCGDQYDVSGLEYGDYTITETTTGYETSYGYSSGSYPYSGSSGDVTVTASDNPIIYFYNEALVTTGSIKVAKVCSGFSDGSFDFTLTNGTITKTTTLSCGGNYTFSDLETGSYTVTETTNETDDYYISSPSQTYVLTAGGSKTLTFTNQKYGYLNITKLCGGGVTSTNGFTFSVNGTSKTVACGATSSNIKLLLGTYTVTETGLPENIKADSTSKSVTITSSHTESSPANVTFTNSLITGSVKIIKTDGITNSYLEGVTFKLLSVSGNSETDATYATTGLPIGNKVTNANGEISIDNLALGTYKLVEVSTTTGYSIIDPVNFTITASKLNVTVNVVNNPISLKVVKTNMDGTINLGNAIFLVSNATTDETTNQFTVEELGTEVNFNPGSYVITEIQAPVGYDLIDLSFNIDVTENGTITISNYDTNYISIAKVTDEYVLTIKNDTPKTTIYKKDSGSGEQIAGATLKITTVAGVEVANWTSEANTAARFDLTAGTYILSEVSAPSGYNKLTETLTFTVLEDGTIETDSESDSFIIDANKISVYNVKPVKVPNTGIGLRIVFIILGVGLIGGGGYLVYKNVKKQKIA